MPDVIIIGAGFSGLAAAARLMEKGCDDFIVLEARDRVGGRTKHGTLAGLDIDLGGMWLGPTQTRLAALARQFQVETYPTHLDGKSIFRLHGREHHGERERMDGLMTWWDKLSYLAASRKLGRLVAAIDCEQPWSHEQAAVLDAQTVEQWVLDNVRSQRVRQLYRLLCFSIFCAEADQISLLFFVNYLKSAGGLEILMSAETGGAQNFLFHGGVHQIARRMGEAIGARLHLDEPVTAIDWHGACATVHSDRGTYQASRVIVAVPPTLVPRIEFRPPLPQPKAALHARVAMGSAIKYWVAYDRPFWREQGFNGSVVRDDAPCSPCFDVSPTGQPLGVIAGFFDGDHALRHGDSSANHRRNAVLSMLAEHFGPAAMNPVDYVEADWTAEVWSGGCYGAYFPPGMFARHGSWLRRAVGRMVWAGTETSRHWTGYIEGAIQSGECAAEEVLSALSQATDAARNDPGLEERHA